LPVKIFKNLKQIFYLFVSNACNPKSSDLL